MPTENKLTLDTQTQVFFYEQDFYVLSNFSAFNVEVFDRVFPTAEHAYHWKKFHTVSYGVALDIFTARSAHDAFKMAEVNKVLRRKDWDAVKVGVMWEILQAKVSQHEYVHRKLLATGDRELIENSWRDAFWGWGPNRDGRNQLGKLWMEIRAELRAKGRADYECDVTQAQAAYQANQSGRNALDLQASKEALQRHYPEVKP